MFTLPHLRNPYASSVPPIVQPWINPDRNSLMNLRFRWHLIRQFAVSTILFFALFSPRHVETSIPAMLGILWLYAIWQFSFGYLFRNRRMASPEWQRRLSIIQFVASSIGATVIIWGLYPVVASDTWLLYLIPLMTIGRSLERRWAFIFILVDVGLLSISAFAPFVHQVPSYLSNGAFDLPMEFSVAVRDFFIRGLTGAYIGFSSYLLVRSLAYQNRIIRYTTERMNEVTKTRSWSTASNAIAEIMAEALSDSKRDVMANVIIYDRDTDLMKIVGSSSIQGQRLAESGYQYPASQGITGWAGRHGSPCYMNDTERDPEARFLPNDAFPNTRSALAVPITVDYRQVVVLDVESPRVFDFADEDVQLLEIVGGHLLASHERTKVLDVHRRLADIGQELAKRIICVEQIPDMLRYIGGVYLDLLKADIISFHYRHSAADLEIERVLVGDLHTTPESAAPSRELDSLTISLMEHQKPEYFPNAPQTEMLVNKRFHHVWHGIQPFVIRESIVSCAAIPLVIAHESVGVMWINFRRNEPFEETIRDLIQLLTPYASLAIQAGLQNIVEEQRRREGLRRMVHDSLSHRLHDVARSLDRLRQSAPGSDKSREEWRIAGVQVSRARQAVTNLITEQTWLTLQSLVEDLQTQAKTIENLYGISVLFTTCDLPPAEISLSGGNELMYACDEAIGNALRHSQLTRLEISIDYDCNNIIVIIRDNGVGFNQDEVAQGLGLCSIKDRICGLGGTTTIESHINHGTSIRFQVPLPTTD